jgi:uncharacterized membrane protein
LFPDRVSDHANEDAYERANGNPAAARGELVWSAVAARKAGYIETIDEDTILEFARKHQTIVRMERGIGEFVVEGAPLMSVTHQDGLDDETVAHLNSVYVISRHRTVQQDVGFGIRQIVDIAMKALSPGINDTTTAVMCVDYLGAILARLAVRQITTPWHVDDGELRVITRGPCFETLLAEAFDQIRQSAEGNVAVLTRQLQSLEIIAGQTSNTRRRQMLRQHADLIIAVADRTIPTPHDCANVHAAWTRLSRT